MATKPKAGSGNDPAFPSAPELICLAAPGAGLRSSRAEVASTRGVSTKSLNALLKAAGAEMTPIFGSEPRVAASRAAIHAAQTASLPELSGYYSVSVAPDKMEKLAADLLKDPTVEAAYVKPPCSPPVWLDENEDGPPDSAPDGEEAPTASFIARQLYLEVAPGGIDARYAWTRTGGKGQGVRVIDVEGAWRFTHEDLLQNQGGVIGGTPSTDIGWRNHGTAVTGVFGGDENGFGVTGISPLANTRAISIFGPGMSSASAIRQAADALTAGDIILIELHRRGPDGNGSGQDGFIAIEWWPDDFAAIVYAASRGVIVIEAGGNGARNLDAAIFNTRPAGFPVSWRNPFNLANPQSRAIIVGAGAPPPGTHGRDHGPDRSRLEFSNYGARVDVQGWGREVTTTGYGDLQGGTNENLWYTDTFSGRLHAGRAARGQPAVANARYRPRHLADHRLAADVGTRQAVHPAHWQPAQPPAGAWRAVAGDQNQGNQDRETREDRTQGNQGDQDREGREQGIQGGQDREKREGRDQGNREAADQGKGREGNLRKNPGQDSRQDPGEGL